VRPGERDPRRDPGAAFRPAPVGLDLFGAHAAPTSRTMVAARLVVIPPGRVAGPFDLAFAR
jgi:hypothetical protein